MGRDHRQLSSEARRSDALHAASTRRRCRGALQLRCRIAAGKARPLARAAPRGLLALPASSAAPTSP